MKNIYDNGALMLGNVQMVINEIEKELKNGVDMFCADMEDILKELKELRDIDYEMIVCINYDNGMGYSIDYWSSKDIVKKGGEK